MAGGRTVLFISYDGMTDPLGQSQVLPYLTGLAARGHDITILSAEKKKRFAAEADAIRRICAAAGIDWQPIPYHQRPPVLSAIYDAAMLERRAVRLHRRKSFGILHCRGYVPALVGARLKRRLGTRFLFDMRGFWADERVDGGQWNLRNPLFAAVYRFFKRRESDWLHSADHVVSLTEEGKRTLLARPDRREGDPPVAVIPCCVDFDHFSVPDAQRRAARSELGIDAEATVLVYVGSLGGNYLLDEMLGLFDVLRKRRTGARFLFVTRHDSAEIRAAAARFGIDADELVIRAAARDEVPRFTAAADLGVAFKQSSFSAKACSPTKLGEMLALGIPVVANAGVGDVEAVLEDSGAGVVVDRFDREAYAEALEALDRKQFDTAKWQQRARHWFDLDAGVDRYDSIYRSLA